MARLRPGPWERPRVYFLWRFVERCSIFYHIYAHQVRQTSCLVSCDLFKDPVFFIEGLSNMFSLLSVALVPSTRPMIWSVCVCGGGGGVYSHTYAIWGRVALQGMVFDCPLINRVSNSVIFEDFL